MIAAGRGGLKFPPARRRAHAPPAPPPRGTRRAPARRVRRSRGCRGAGSAGLHPDTAVLGDAGRPRAGAEALRAAGGRRPGAPRSPPARRGHRRGRQDSNLRGNSQVIFNHSP
jgi:hypothetical protein